MRSAEGDEITEGDADSNIPLVMEGGSSCGRFVVTALLMTEPLL
jgi:hypothetical protein